MQEMLKALYEFCMDHLPYEAWEDGESMDRDEMWLQNNLKGRAERVFSRYQEETEYYHFIMEQQAFNAGLQCGMQFMQFAFGQRKNVEFN